MIKKMLLICMVILALGCYSPAPEEPVVVTCNNVYQGYQFWSADDKNGLSEHSQELWQELNDCGCSVVNSQDCIDGKLAFTKSKLDYYIESIPAIKYMFEARCGVIEKKCLDDM